MAGPQAVAGLWAATAALGVCAVLGSSRQLSLGPESTTAFLTATTFAVLAACDPHGYAVIAAHSPCWSAPLRPVASLTAGAEPDRVTFVYRIRAGVLTTQRGWHTRIAPWSEYPGSGTRWRHSVSY